MSLDEDILEPDQSKDKIGIEQIIITEQASPSIEKELRDNTRSRTQRVYDWVADPKNRMKVGLITGVVSALGNDGILAINTGENPFMTEYGLVKTTLSVLFPLYIANMFDTGIKYLRESMQEHTGISEHRATQASFAIVNAIWAGLEYPLQKFLGNDEAIGSVLSFAATTQALFLGLTYYKYHEEKLTPKIKEIKETMREITIDALITKYILTRPAVQYGVGAAMELIAATYMTIVTAGSKLNGKIQVISNTLNGKNNHNI